MHSRACACFILTAYDLMTVLFLQICSTSSTNLSPRDHKSILTDGTTKIKIQVGAFGLLNKQCWIKKFTMVYNVRLSCVCQKIEMIINKLFVHKLISTSARPQLSCLLTAQNYSTESSFIWSYLMYNKNKWHHPNPKYLLKL